MQRVVPVSPLTPLFEPKDVFGDIDYTQPLSTLLRTSTRRAHDAMENSELASKLLRGELLRGEYIYLMMILWRVYNVIEDSLNAHSTNSVLAPTYRPTLLGRTGRISSDIAYLLNTTEDDWQLNPLYLSLVSAPPPGVRSYVAYLEKLDASNDSVDHSRLLAHAYVRYMGDLSGGQMIRNKLVKVYDLPETGAGASFYDFGPLQGSSDLGEKRASRAEVSQIKDWYSQGMNEGVGDDRGLKEAIIREANLAFEFNGRLFQDVATAIRNIELSNYTPQSKLIFDASQEPQEKTYPVSSVVAVIMALVLAHFILVVGGFTGAKGAEKLESVMLWLRAVAGHS